jgi:hypothetical protein
MAAAAARQKILLKEAIKECDTSDLYTTTVEDVDQPKTNQEENSDWLSDVDQWAAEKSSAGAANVKLLE